ncbi:MAG: STN domain-containing protein, partial [Bacteroidetes bacterium]|nr:STN domain-containing protein [Bacteroidota bacterium]
MKLTLVLLTAFLFTASAKSVSQNVSFSGENVRLEAIFPAVEKQTGYVFIYKKTILKDFRPVTINVANMPLEQFLQQVFRSQLLQYEIKGKNIV